MTVPTDPTPVGDDWACEDQMDLLDDLEGVTCPEAVGPAACRVPGPHDSHLYVTDPVWVKAGPVLEALWAAKAATT